MSHQPKQRILVFEQCGGAENKIAGIRGYGGEHLELRRVSIDQPLPPVIDDAAGLLPGRIDCDLVLDFLKHPDLSHDLAERCRRLGVPVVASGKKIAAEGVLTPPT